MKKTILPILMLALLLVSITFIASADGQSQVQACAATAPPFITDAVPICATCIAALGNGKGDIGACECKLFQAEDPAGFGAMFSNFGECVQSVEQGNQ